ncbi:uncharacterized protein LOC122869313 isoform X2 [Scomber scombrus]|uniref:Uncharacterized protein LOC122869313 isoform X2 n=1 Tax=Scomber scombrus TaxID=13677 RepID=A0AAV1P8N7_SCOSC
MESILMGMEYDSRDKAGLIFSVRCAEENQKRRKKRHDKTAHQSAVSLKRCVQTPYQPESPRCVKRPRCGIRDITLERKLKLSGIKLFECDDRVYLNSSDEFRKDLRSRIGCRVIRGGHFRGFSHSSDSSTHTRKVSLRHCVRTAEKVAFKFLFAVRVGHSTFRKLWRQTCCGSAKKTTMPHSSSSLPDCVKSATLRKQEQHLFMIGMNCQAFQYMVASCRATVGMLGVKFGPNTPCRHDLTMHYSRLCTAVCCEGVPQQVTYLINEGHWVLTQSSFTCDISFRSGSERNVQLHGQLLWTDQEQVHPVVPGLAMHGGSS